MVDELPRKFGKYVLERRLGVGGMAETFVARREGHANIVQHVCLKRVLPAFNEDQSFREQFQREAKLAARLRHTNIVGTIDYGSVGSTQYMAIELVDGVDLRELLQHGDEHRLDAELVAWVGMELAHALEYAHRSREKDEGIVHRDVTPANVLLSCEGEVKLADFGVAKAIGTATVMTATGIMKGKVPYMPPEQMTSTDIDGRVDLFSLGVLMYEALAGRRPFVGAHDVMVMSAIISGEYPPVTEFAPDAPPALVETIHALLETDRDERVPSATALIDRLAPCVPDHGARTRLAALVRDAYGEDKHDGAASDTRLQESVDLPGFSRAPESTDRSAAPTFDTDPKAPAPQSDSASHSPAAPTQMASGAVEVTSGGRPARATIRDMAKAAQEAQARTQIGIGPSAAATPPAEAHARVETGAADAAPLGSVGQPVGQPAPTSPQPPTVPEPQAPASNGPSRAVYALVAAALMAAAGGGIWWSQQPPPVVAARNSQEVRPDASAEAASSEASAETPTAETPTAETPSIETAPSDPPLPIGVEPPNLETDEQLGTRGDEEAATMLADPTPRDPSAAGSAMNPSTMLDEPPPVRLHDPNPNAPMVAAADMESMAPPSMSASRVPVTVTVVPWGNVWVGNRFMGRAPVEVSLAPGNHVIRAGYDSALSRQRVRVRADTPRTVEFDLTDPD